jgi:hypothetical protein
MVAECDHSYEMLRAFIRKFSPNVLYFQVIPSSMQGNFAYILSDIVLVKRIDFI